MKRRRKKKRWIGKLFRSENKALTKMLHNQIDAIFLYFLKEDGM